MKHCGDGCYAHITSCFDSLFHPHCCITGILGTLFFTFPSSWTSYIQICYPYVLLSAHLHSANKSVNHRGWHVLIKLTLSPSCISGWATYSWCFHYGGLVNRSSDLERALTMRDTSTAEYLLCAVRSCDQTMIWAVVFHSSTMKWHGKMCCLSCVGGVMVTQTTVNTCHLQFFN